MGYSQFLNMVPEVTLMAILIIVFIADFVSSRNNNRKWFNPLVCILMLIQVVATLLSPDAKTAFGEMYVTTAATNVMKVVLAAGTLIVLIQSRLWLSREDVRNREGEFYMIVLSTLLGMNVMMSSGHFLMFFLGLEMASVPMACIVAYDKYRRNSAEGAAKFILTATFSSGVMLYGISFIYGSVGTLYFADVAAALSSSESLAMNIMGLVFFFSGLGFKISLVPFHFWTADAYQGAPTTVTGYLSVISKGAAAFTLMAILMKAFAPLVEYWQYLLYIVIVLSITVANLFAILQHDLKRFMAYSSISQAGYIVLAALDPSPQGMASLVYYVFVYVFANMAIFGAITAIEAKTQAPVTMDTCRALYSTNPKLSFVMTIALFSLAGIPPFAGFFSKFFVFAAAFKAGHWIVVFIALINTVVSLYYYMLIVKAIYISPSDEPLQHFRCRRPMRWSLLLCTLALMVVGLCSAIYTYMFNAAQI